MIKLEKLVYLIQKAFLNLIHFFVYTSLFVFHFSFNVSPVFYVQGIHILWTSHSEFMILCKWWFSYFVIETNGSKFYIDNCQLKNFFGKKKLFVTFLEIKRTADYSCLTTIILNKYYFFVQYFADLEKSSNSFGIF